MSDYQFSTVCPMSGDEKHVSIATPIWVDEDGEMVTGSICKLCGEEL